jgi:membrane associated rhomboid family serine protease
MIPIKDLNPTRRRSIVVPVLIAINVVVFFFVEPVIEPGKSAEQRVTDQQTFFICKAAIPYELSHGERLADALTEGKLSTIQDSRLAEAEAAYQAGKLPEIGPGCPRKNIWLSALTSMFLHASFLHIAGNMLFLWVFGDNVEDRLGRIRFIIFYFLCGLAATAAQTFVSPSSSGPMIGASGAIAGVLGAYLVMFPRARVRTLIFFFFITLFDVPAVVLLGLWFLLQVFQGVGSVSSGSGVAYMAHIGGFIAGMALLLVFRPRPVPPAGYPPYPAPY